MPETLLTPLAPASRYILRVRDPERVTDPALPLEACRVTLSEDWQALWLGPDEFLLIAVPPPNSEGRGGGLEASLQDIPHSLVEVSDRQLALALEGPHAADVLNAGCPLDLDLAAFPVGMCTRTVFAKAEIVLWRQAEHRFHVEVWRSFSDYVRQLLEQVISEYDTAV